LCRRSAQRKESSRQRFASRRSCRSASKTKSRATIPLSGETRKQKSFDYLLMVIINMLNLAAKLQKRQCFFMECSQRLQSTFFKVEPGTAADSLKPKKQQEGLLVQRPWAIRPFLNSEKMVMPIFDFQTGDFLNEGVGKLFCDNRVGPRVLQLVLAKRYHPQSFPLLPLAGQTNYCPVAEQRNRGRFGYQTFRSERKRKSKSGKQASKLQERRSARPRKTP